MGIKKNTKKINKENKTSKQKPNSKKDNDNLLLIKNLSNQLESLKDRNIKLLAEFDNYQKRTLLEKERASTYDGYNIIKDLLPVFDDIDRTIDFNKEENSKSILEAISMIDSKIQNILSKYSIKKIDSIDEEFNPSFHEALLQKESNKKEGKIIEEYEKGYLYHDKIIRHAKVVVSKGKNKWEIIMIF